MNLRTVEDPYETYNNSSLPYRMIFSQKNKSSGSCFINDILYRQQGWTRTHSAHYYEKKNWHYNITTSHILFQRSYLTYSLGNDTQFFDSREYVIMLFADLFLPTSPLL